MIFRVSTKKRRKTFRSNFGALSDINKKETWIESIEYNENPFLALSKSTEKQITESI